MAQRGAAGALGGVSLRTFRKWLLDATGLETGFSTGMIRDVERWMIPQGGSYTISDFLIDQPGELRKRGGTAYQSAEVFIPNPINPLWTAVFCPDFPNDNERILGIVTDGGQHRYLVDVTSATSGDTPIQIDIEPWENPSTFIGGQVAMAIITSGDPTVRVPPKKVEWPPGTTDIVVNNLGGNPPAAKVSSKWGSYFVLANDGGSDQNKIWFSGYNNPEVWDTVNSQITVPEPVIAMTEFQGVLLIWTRHAHYRLLGSTPPHLVSGTAVPATSADIRLQPVSQIGCLDARSVIKSSSTCFFANEEGIFLTDGASVQNLTLGKGNVISSLWRQLMNGFDISLGHVICAGIFQDIHLIVTVIKGLDNVATLLCYLPTGGWSLLTNPCAGSMYANSIATVYNHNNLYCAALTHNPANMSVRMVQLAEIFDPSSDNAYEADGVTPVEPWWESRVIPGASTGLKRFGNGRLIYQMSSSASAQIHISTELGLASEGSFKEVKEGSPQGWTVGVERHRFRIYQNGLGIKFKLEQKGASDFTNIFGIEYEMAPFFTAEMQGEGEGT